MMENMIKSGIVQKIKIIQLSTHYFSQVEDLISRFCKIRESLNKTHHMVWGQPFAWERWERRLL